MLLFSAILVDARSCGLSLSLSLHPPRVYTFVSLLRSFPHLLRSVEPSSIKRSLTRDRKVHSIFPHPSRRSQTRVFAFPCAPMPSKECNFCFVCLRLRSRRGKLNENPSEWNLPGLGAIDIAKRRSFEERKMHLERSLPPVPPVAISFSLSTILLARGKFTIKKDTWVLYWTGEMNSMLLRRTR